MTQTGILAKVVCIKNIDGFIKNSIYDAWVETTLNRNIDIFADNTEENLYITTYTLVSNKKVYYDSFMTLSDFREKQMKNILDD